jgi:uncharacterized protein
MTDSLLDRIVYARPNELRSVWRLILFGLAVFAAANIVVPLVSIVVPAALMPWLRPTLQCGGVLCATYWLTHSVESGGWRIVWLDRAAWRKRPLVIGAFAGVAAIGIPTLILIAFGGLSFVSQPMREVGRTLLMSFAVLAPAALTEELLTRGYPFAVLEGAWGWPMPAALTSFVFGMLHIQNPGTSALAISNVMAAGVFLASVRLVTGSLAAAWAAHFAWNWTMSAGFHTAVSGLPFGTPGYALVDTGPDWLTGGSWGPEGGVLAAIGMIGTFAGLSWATNRHRRAEISFAASLMGSSNAGALPERQEHDV